jgi:hypothetical protein
MDSNAAARPGAATRSRVAIVVPTSRATFTADEEISLRHLEHYLGRYDRYFVVPRRTSIRRAGYETIPFSRRYFGSPQAHSRLQLSEQFYTRFRCYEYLLMYHLDALVLSDRLEHWCGTGLDFVGAPWLPCADSPWVNRASVGNSGFALMKVESFLRVIRSRALAVDPEAYWRQLSATASGTRRLLQLPRRYLKRLPVFNSARWESRRWTSQGDGLGNADYFWSVRATAYCPEFRIASVEQGLEFAFEVAPRLCFAMNKGRLPFGAHAWARFDRAFWEPHLLT